MQDHLPLNDPKLDCIRFSSDDIAGRIDELARQIHQVYADKSDLCVFALMTGACLFASDLVRALYKAGQQGISLICAKASTYANSVRNGAATCQGQTKCFWDTKIASKNILLVDDLMDMGTTLASVRNTLQAANPEATIRTCVLLKKNLNNPSAAVQENRRKCPLDFYGFEVEDRWVVGYGMDAAGLYRELPYIAFAHEEYFK